MNSENLFKLAVERKETDEFFRGVGNYYSHNPMDGGHCYGVRLSGDVNKFVASDPRGAQVFSQCFKAFVDSLSADYGDLTHLLANVSEIQHFRKKGLLLGVDFDQDIDSDVILSIVNYLEITRWDEKCRELMRMYLRLLEMDDSQATALVIRKKLNSN
ncbi:hypothetical protein HXX02_16940 [Microbulbifer elongatus]|uniref:Uncharacterized protein n=1 Tax=Microbulbifer elongatus TaxID=86173 RepID=A0ABT1P4U4_9GAMM|nr:hypothetical protein [Microbulbifer elongatus]MCQ3831123.1 hypothetical protein [Microbulbifer elongatus]